MGNTRGICHRYTDDVMIFYKSLKDANRVDESVTIFIEEVLDFKVNREKTTVSYINRELKYLGHCFYLKKSGKLKVNMGIHKKSREKLIDKVSIN
ncbi:reverse transcriptase domain-containing protein [Psittacicella hinzii]|uniref:reverse transcriptase domain-containing protein n=1 Tax=Psittacicella hinzii TaxID=2028575 RepID=UPI00361F3B4B